MTDKELANCLLMAIFACGVLVTANCWWLCLVFVGLLAVVTLKQ